MPVTYPIEIPGNSPFGIQNIPFGIYSTTGNVSIARHNTQIQYCSFRLIYLTILYFSLVGLVLPSVAGS